MSTDRWWTTVNNDDELRDFTPSAPLAEEKAEQR
jgi:hypothetical protein